MLWAVLSVGTQPPVTGVRSTQPSHWKRIAITDGDSPTQSLTCRPLVTCHFSTCLPASVDLATSRAPSSTSPSSSGMTAALSTPPTTAASQWEMTVSFLQAPASTQPGWLPALWPMVTTSPCLSWLLPLRTPAVTPGTPQSFRLLGVSRTSPSAGELGPSLAASGGAYSACTMIPERHTHSPFAAPQL